MQLSLEPPSRRFPSNRVAGVHFALSRLNKISVWLDLPSGTSGFFVSVPLIEKGR